MTERLTWIDLIEEPPTAEVAQRWCEEWLQPWASILEGLFAPVFMNKFGMWFLRRPDGAVDLLDIFTGQLSRITNAYDDFVSEVNDRSWQEVYLLSELVYQLHGEAKKAGPGECYAIAPHPAWGGPNPFLGDAVETRFISVLSTTAWQGLCVQAVLGENTR